MFYFKIYLKPSDFVTKTYILPVHNPEQHHSPAFELTTMFCFIKYICNCPHLWLKYYIIFKKLHIDSYWLTRVAMVFNIVIANILLCPDGVFGELLFLSHPGL
jgi:hypothetical protein